MSSDDDGPAPSPSAAVLARRASREAKSMREESMKVCRRASRQRRERELTAERIQKYICTLYRETNKAGENPRPRARADEPSACLLLIFR